MDSNLLSNLIKNALHRATLRTKAILTGLVIALSISAFTSLAIFQIAESYLTNQRIAIATSQISVASRLAAQSIYDGNTPLDSLLTASNTFPNAQTAIRQNDEWFVSKAGFDIDEIPDEVIDLVTEGSPARSRIMFGESPAIAIGIPITINDAVKYQFIGVVTTLELQRTLSLLQSVLLAGVLFSSIGGAFVGFWLSRRVSEPLHDVSEAAQRIAFGDLTIQIATPSEPDLKNIADTFNFMTKSLQNRIAREARFGAVVSHELKSPLTAIRGATDLLDGMRNELPQKATLSLDILNERVRYFERILNDLIEISRYESGTVQANLEELAVQPLLNALLDRDQRVHIELIDSTSTKHSIALVDSKRFQQIFENLVSNADAYAHGLSAIRIEESEQQIVIHFDDSGIGISNDIEIAIFDPFFRAPQHSAHPGSGLGLTISKEHANIMGGDLIVSKSPDGGARFSLQLRRPKDHL
jgi:signal transduction histidine kinase